MKNKIHYLDELMDILASIDAVIKTCDFVKVHVLHSDNCECVKDCKECMAAFREWLEADYIEFTEDELVILKNINNNYKYISRDIDGNLEVTDSLPSNSTIWDSLEVYNHIFNGIKNGQTFRIDQYSPFEEAQDECDCI